MNENNDVKEIDLLQLLRAVAKRWWIVLISSIAAAGIAFSYTYFFVTPKYQSSILLYVNNSNISVGSISISSAELSAAKTLVDTYCVVLKSRLTLEEVIKDANLSYSYSELKDMISAASENNTEIFRITVTSENAEEACLIANTIAKVLPEKIADIVNGSSVKNVDMGIVPDTRSSPSYSKNTVLGFVVGLALSVIALAVAELMNDKITSEDWLIQTYGDEIPLLAVVPDANARSSKGYYRYYKYDQNK